MQVSKHLEVIEFNEYALCFHSLLGNLNFLEPSYLSMLKKFDANVKHQSNELIIVEELREAHYLEEGEENARTVIANCNKEWMKLIPGGGQLRLLNLVISEACNFGCKHCLHSCSVKNSETHGSKKIMGWETAKLAIDSYTQIIRNAGNGPLSVHFGSAEPLLNWDVMQRSIVYTKDLDSEASLSVNTNLSLMTLSQASFLKEYGVYIATSLDGPPEGNDAIRTYRNGKGTHKDILRAIDIMSEVGYPLDGFSITINDLNFDFIDENFIDWASKRGFEGIATDIDLINVKNANRSIDECLEKLLDLRHACQERGIENTGSWTTIYDSLVNGVEDGMTTFCKAAKGRNISVNPEGQLFICGHTTSLLGTLDRFEEAFEKNGPYYELVESRLPGNDPQCFGCSIEGICAGQCQITREVAEATGNGRANYLCKFLRQATFQLLKEKLDSEIQQELTRR
ncbi:MAG: radical SAM protein [Patescibacteria group bacterium]